MEKPYFPSLAWLAAASFTLAGACALQTGGLAPPGTGGSATTSASSAGSTGSGGASTSSGSSGSGASSSSAGSSGGGASSSSTSASSSTSSSSGPCGPGGLQAHCCNGKKDGNETGVDCGGPDCAKCPDGQGCMMSGDCQGGNCAPGMICCAATCGGCMTCDPMKNGMKAGCANVVSGQDPNKACTGEGTCDGNDKCSCQNGVKDGTETDVDCGGMCPSKCADTKSCAAGGDCVSNFCVGGTTKICCHTDCTGACNACDLVNFAGTCEHVIPGRAGGCMSGKGCDSSQSCQTGGNDGSSCSNNNQCWSGYCDMQNSHKCQANQPSGAICVFPADCQSGQCMGDHTCN